MEKAIVSIQNAKIGPHWQRESLQENRDFPGGLTPCYEVSTESKALDSKRISGKAESSLDS